MLWWGTIIKREGCVIMKCKGIFVFKSLTHRPAGTFKNDNDEDVNYPSAYILKVDELGDNGEINERKFKIAEDKTQLINDLKSLDAYERFALDFKVTIYTSRISLEPVSIDIGNIDIDE